MKVKLHREAVSAETHFMAREPENGQFSLERVEQVELGVYSDNDRARHMYRKMGFREYGMNPRAFKLKDGTYRDEIIMANIFES